MEEKLKEAMDLVLQALKAGVQELPEIAREALAYAFWREMSDVMIGGVICMVLIAACVGIGMALRKALKADRYFDGEGYMFGLFFTGVGAFISLCVTVSNALDVVKVVYAPRLYLLEWFAHMVK